MLKSKRKIFAVAFVVVVMATLFVPAVSAYSNVTRPIIYFNRKSDYHEKANMYPSQNDVAHGWIDYNSPGWIRSSKITATAEALCATKIFLYTNWTDSDKTIPPEKHQNTIQPPEKYVNYSVTSSGTNRKHVCSYTGCDIVTYDGSGRCEQEWNSY